jgi:hypothetical protein
VFFIFGTFGLGNSLATFSKILANIFQSFGHPGLGHVLKLLFSNNISQQPLKIEKKAQFWNPLIKKRCLFD